MYLMSIDFLDELCLKMKDAIAESCDNKKNKILAEMLVSVRDVNQNRSRTRDILLVEDV